MFSDLVWSSRTSLAADFRSGSRQWRLLLTLSPGCRSLDVGAAETEAPVCLINPHASGSSQSARRLTAPWSHSPLSHSSCGWCCGGVGAKHTVTHSLTQSHTHTHKHTAKTNTWIKTCRHLQPRQKYVNVIFFFCCCLHAHARAHSQSTKLI